MVRACAMYRWLSARLQSLQCVSKGVIATLHWDNDMKVEVGARWPGWNPPLTSFQFCCRWFIPSVPKGMGLCNGMVASWGLAWLSWASYQIRKITGCACAGNVANVSPRRRLQRKPLVGDPGMHHGTCVTHVPRCMSGSLTCGDGDNVSGIPGACAPAILRIW